MEKEDIVHLAKLSRIRISDSEAEALREDIESVLAYVSEIDAITADTGITKTVGSVYNVFRQDIVTNEADSYTQAILQEAPNVKGRHLLVKKIIQQD